MPDVNLPMATFEGSDKDKLQNLYDVITMYRKELDYLLRHLDTKNVLIAQRAEIAEIYAGTIEANKITTVNAKITNAQIDSIEANKITTNEAKISTAQIDALTVGGNVNSGDAVMKNTFYNRTKITTADGIQVFDNQAIPVDRVKIGQFDTNLYGIVLKNANGDTVLTQDTNGNITLTTANSDVTISPTGVTINNGKLAIKDINGNALFIDGYGIDPSFLRWFPNLLANSEFTNASTPVADPTSDFTPKYWSGGVSSYNATFIGQRSLVIDEAS